jgi:heptose-I-phosphate ethanolaminephosphotransferase
MDRMTEWEKGALSTSRMMGWLCRVGHDFRLRASCGFFFLCLLLLLPAFSRTLAGFLHALWIWLFVLAVVNRRKVLAILSLPVLLSLPAVLYYQHVYRIAPGASLWLILFGSSLEETLEYLSGFTWVLIPALLVCGTVWFWSIRKLTGKIFSKRAVRLICLLGGLIPLVGIAIESRRDRDVVKAANNYFRNSYPWSVASGYLQARNELRAFAEAEQVASEGGSIALQSSAMAERPRTVVLVIGESARRDQHHIYGHDVANTPMAGSLAGLLAFDNLVTLYPYTTDSVPVILARNDRLGSGTTDVPNLLRAFRSVGYQTSWISNQAEMGQDDSQIGAYARQADERWFGRKLSRFGAIPFDDSILPIFTRQLATDAPHKFIVVHLFGSHEDVSKRYPESYQIHPGAYDNSIQYTDSILGRIVSELQQAPGDNALVYISDHGIRLGECNGGVEHYDLKQAYEVPFYVWMSPQWIVQRPALYAHASGKRSAPLTTMDVWGSVMALADVFPEEVGMIGSIFSSVPEGRIRRVKTFADWVDYDRSENDHQCHLRQLEE